jgi:hypothetical protein
MDRISDQVIISFTDLQKEGVIREPWQMLLRIDASFSFSIHDCVVLRESHFNVVELAAEFARWLAKPLTDFSYKSKGRGGA